MVIVHGLFDNVGGVKSRSVAGSHWKKINKEFTSFAQLVICYAHLGVTGMVYSLWAQKGCGGRQLVCEKYHSRVT